MQRCKSGARRWRRTVTIKTADAEAMQIRVRRGTKRATIKRADAEAIETKGPQREE